MVEKTKEKLPASQKTKEKVQSAPKELLRRGLLDGTEKLRGQLRDAAERGQREEDISDRAHGFATQGTRLVVNRLDRMRLGKEKAKEQSSDSPPEPAPHRLIERSHPPRPRSGGRSKRGMLFVMPPPKCMEREANWSGPCPPNPR